MPEAVSRFTPDQLVALNDEIATLVRAGVPLELGLRQLSGSVPTALARISRQISEKMEAGKPLGQSISDTLPGLPRLYSAVVEAGLKSGDLPKALEALSRFAQQGTELRNRIEFAFVYPLFIFLVSYGLFLVFVIQTAAHWQQIWGEFVPVEDSFVSALANLSRTWQQWAWIPPAIVAGLVGWWIIFARASFLPDRRPSLMLGVIPGLRSIVTLWHWANFCDLLATLLQHQTPLPQAITLAADATGNSTIHEQMSAVSADLRTGRSMADCLRGRNKIPAYLRWSLASAQQPDAFQNALRHAVELYRNRATFRADMIKMWLPLALIVIVAGGAALMYALTLSLPLRALYWQLNLDSMR